ncbi:MAG: DinB family protein [Bacteroidota bacterium]
MKQESLGKNLRRIVLFVKEELLKRSESESIIKPAPDRWSPKEIIGHLIDSASNNHQRFVRAQFKEDMIFQGYAQDEWVIVQAYQKRSWEELVELWAQFNLQIAHVMDSCSEEIRLKERGKHNFHQIAFKRVSETEPTSLQYFMVDYISHLEHHILSILPAYVAQTEAYQNDFHILKT